MRIYVLRDMRFFYFFTLFSLSVFVKKLVVRRLQYTLYDSRVTMCTTAVIRAIDGRQTTTLWLKSLQHKLVKYTGQSCNQSSIKAYR